MKSRTQASAALLLPFLLAAGYAPAKAQGQSPWDAAEQFVKKCSNAELIDATKAPPQTGWVSKYMILEGDAATPNVEEAREDSEAVTIAERARAERAQKIADLLLDGDDAGAAALAKTTAEKTAADGGRPMTPRDAASLEHIAHALVALAGIESDQKLFYYVHGRFSNSICELAAATSTRDPHLYFKSMSNFLDFNFGIRMVASPTGYRIYTRARDDDKTQIYFRGPPKYSAAEEKAEAP